MIDAKLTKTDAGYYDLDLQAGKFTMCEDGTEAASHCVIRLLAYKGEYNLGGLLTGKDDLGVDWYGIVFNVATGEAEKTFELRKAILGTPGVVSINKFEWSQTGQVVTIDGAVNTEWGVVELSMEIEQL